MLQKAPTLILILLLASCNAQPVQRAPVVITHDTVPIPNDRLVPLYHEGQLCHWVRNMHQDTRGALWFGTNHYGAIRYANDTLEYLADSVGITMGRINGIAEDADGNVWLATDGGGLFKYDPTAARTSGGHGFSQYTTADGLLHNEIWSMTIARDGTIWLGTMGGLCTFTPTAMRDQSSKAFTTIPTPTPQPTAHTPMLGPLRITCILEDGRGNIWFGRDAGGLFMLDPRLDAGSRTFMHYTEENGLADNSVTGLMEDSKGRVWIGSSFGGVSRFDPNAAQEPGGKAFTNFTKDGVITGEEVGALYEDRAGHIWFAAENDGVYRYDGKTFIRYTKEDGADINGILAILEDREGRFWFGGWKGLFRFDGKRFFPVTKTGPWEP